MILIDYIMNNLSKTHKQAKQLLTKGCILVQGKPVTKYNYEIKSTDDIKVLEVGLKAMKVPFEIIYEDSNIIVVNKEHGLLTIATESEKVNTLYHKVSNYLKSKNKNAKVFVIHRLDKETSGIVMFAKNSEVKESYQVNWEELVKYRGYYAVVEGKPLPTQEIVNYIKEEDNFKVYISDKRNGKKAITKYKIIKSNSMYSILDVEIKTGRKNQIRVTMNSIDSPIVGDKKYGSVSNPIKRVCLHAYRLDVINPINKRLMQFKSDMPNEFKKIVK